MDPRGRPIRVICVDDMPDVAAVIRLVLDAEPDIECVAVLDSADDLVGESTRLHPDVLIIDATMPGKDPFQAIAEMRDALPDAAAIMYSGHSDTQLVDRAVEAGAWGWVGKHESPEELIRAVRQVAEGRPWFPVGGHPA